MEKNDEYLVPFAKIFKLDIFFYKHEKHALTWQQGVKHASLMRQLHKLQSKAGGYFYQLGFPEL